MENRKQNLAAAISKVVGANVEITVRGEKAFTFSVDHVDQDFEFALVSFFGKSMAVEGVSIDEECGTFVYMVAA